MNSIAENIRKFHEAVPPGVEIVAVSKFHPDSMIMEAYEAGQHIFGESRVQEFVEKVKTLPSDIQWHFIGHLQTNKVRQIIGKTSLIESVDSERILDLIDRESERAGVVTKVLLQVHVAAEEAKFGFSPEELMNYFENLKYRDLKATHICGLMGMATNTEDTERVREDFRTLHSLFEEVKRKSIDLKGFNQLSMGMSGDWPIAVEEGSNIIRIGSAIFGERK
ncbi:MAG: YggS family pyridoxal phosphate-dependent enzyme [Muribaculaceae bacterium]|nr:YggS family pyridoxal phosphate-dependent enzyme [Muribaculaceae bacterium]